MNKSMRIMLSAAVFVLLAGCGAKGPLILPEKVVPIEAPTEIAPETVPESTTPTDSTEPATVPADAPAEGTVETPLPPAKDD